MSASALSVYVHVPYCASRCGYCDFNTYTAAELGPGVTREAWLPTAIAELDLAVEALATERQTKTVFFGGGTPTLLPAADLVEMLAAIDQRWPLVSGAEVTTEANPDSVDRRYLEELRAGGFNRISFGMQSASSRVLQLLDRTHSAERALQAVGDAKAAGFEHINLDLIYGTPGETLAEFAESVRAAVSTGVDHVSAYALTIEEGSRIGARHRRGEFPATTEDDLADKYEVADDLLHAAGFEWYEISNWAKPGAECQHNIAYWQNADWWGIGPGAHSHFVGQRFHNHKHPAKWTASIASGELPWAESERLSAEERALEDLMLGIRLKTGFDTVGLNPESLDELHADGLIESAGGAKVRLTRRGRLLADRVLHSLSSN